MHRFSIFIKENKLYWTTNKIIYSILFSNTCILLFKNKVLQIENDWFDKILISILVSTFIIGVVLSLFNLGRTKLLKGKLDGFLEFKNDGIYIQDKIFTLEQIKNIYIENEDYYGKSQTTKGNFGPALSNGTDNFITLKLYSGETKKYQFELYDSADFQKIKNELLHYYLLGKIQFSNLTYVLGEKSDEEIKEFKIFIEKIASHKSI